MSQHDLVEVSLPDGTQVKSDPSGDEAAAGTFAQDAHGRELSRGAAVEVLAGEDAGTHGRVQDVSGQYITVTFPDGSALRTSAANVRTMGAVLGPVACPYCDKTVTLDGWQRLGAHRSTGGVCDGSSRLVERADARGRAVFARAVTMAARIEDLKRGDVLVAQGKKITVVESHGDTISVSVDFPRGAVRDWTQRDLDRTGAVKA